MLTEFGIHYKLESCEAVTGQQKFLLPLHLRYTYFRQQKGMRAFLSYFVGAVIEKKRNALPGSKVCAVKKLIQHLYFSQHSKKNPLSFALKKR